MRVREKKYLAFKFRTLIFHQPMKNHKRVHLKQALLSKPYKKNKI